MPCSEHFIHASDKLHVMLSVLFNSAIIHGHLPDRLMVGLCYLMTPGLSKDIQCHV